MLLLLLQVLVLLRWQGVGVMRGVLLFLYLSVQLLLAGLSLVERPWFTLGLGIELFRVRVLPFYGLPPSKSAGFALTRTLVDALLRMMSKPNPIPKAALVFLLLRWKGRDWWDIGGLSVWLLLWLLLLL